MRLWVSTTPGSDSDSDSTISSLHSPDAREGRTWFGDVDGPSDVGASSQQASMMSSDGEQGGSHDTGKGKGRTTFTDEDFARSLFADDALAQFEDFSGEWLRYAPEVERTRMLDEFLNEQSVVGVPQIIADLAATLRILHTSEAPSESVEEESTESVVTPTVRLASFLERDGITCTACKCPITDTYAKLACGNVYDMDCLKRMFEANVNDEYRFPPRCCGQVVPLHHVQDQLSQETLDLYKAKIVEYNTPSRLYCSNAQCAQFLGARQTSAASVACAACSTETCAMCTAAAHAATQKCKVDKGVRDALKLGQSNGWQRCPRCRQLVERHEGCFHMSCRCGAQFCYLCAGNWGLCKCWQRKRFLFRMIVSRWLHLRGNYLMKDEPAAKSESSVAKICKQSWRSVKKVVTPIAGPSRAV